MKKENNVEAQLFHFQEWLHSAKMDADKVAPEKIRNIGEAEIQLCCVSINYFVFISVNSLYFVNNIQSPFI